MLDELRAYENLGTPKYFWELLTQVNGCEDNWSVDDTNQYFFNRIIDGVRIFDGCIQFAEAIGVIKVDSDGCITLDAEFDPLPRSENHLHNKMVEKLFMVLKDDDILQGIFSSENVSYDIIYRSIQIDNAAFSLKYSNFKDLLVSFGFLTPHPDVNIPKYVVNGRYRRLFDQILLPEIKRRKIGINELRKSVEQKQVYGDEAEKFVLGYEKIRLAEHPNLDKIEIISEYDVSAGYDLVSFCENDSTEIDRFVEVKSFSGSPYFYWSRNEVDTARIRRDTYYLYLVDRDKLNDEDYIPLIIQDPYVNILDKPEEWNKRVESYFISHPV
ncbi:MAG: hypothetical protein JWO35_781 [Candidatus Saccharibacteria bacterium]|nr:hypothetical protein [Candidatus Saccharibacteria bacterium]